MTEPVVLVPVVDLALAHRYDHNEIKMVLIAGPTQVGFMLSRQVAATLAGELARALAMDTSPRLSSRMRGTDGTPAPASVP